MGKATQKCYRCHGRGMLAGAICLICHGTGIISPLPHRAATPHKPQAAPERIVAVAVRFHGLTITLPAPARHGDVLHPLYDLTGNVLGGQDQGFPTSAGRFVDRKEAVDIAKAAGQIDAPRWPPDLYSEDLW